MPERNAMLNKAEPNPGVQPNEINLSAAGMRGDLRALLFKTQGKAPGAQGAMRRLKWESGAYEDAGRTRSSLVV